MKTSWILAFVIILPLSAAERKPSQYSKAEFDSYANAVLAGDKEHIQELRKVGGKVYNIEATMFSSWVDSNREVSARPVEEWAEVTPGLPPEALKIMPLIIFDATPLPNVVNILSRKARINLGFDPGVTWPTTPDGQQPKVSIHLKSVSPYQALEEVLANHGMQLIFDNKTDIARVTTKEQAAGWSQFTGKVKAKFDGGLIVVISPSDFIFLKNHPDYNKLGNGDRIDCWVMAPLKREPKQTQYGLLPFYDHGIPVETEDIEKNKE